MAPTPRTLRKALPHRAEPSPSSAIGTTASSKGAQISSPSVWGRADIDPGRPRQPLTQRMSQQMRTGADADADSILQCAAPAPKTCPQRLTAVLSRLIQVL